MSRHRSAHPAIQLFPFLAVLVSVMGALIFLLLVTSKRIPQVAVARAKAAESKVATPSTEDVEPVLSIPELPSAPSEAEWPAIPVAELDEEGPSLAELQAQEREAAREAEQQSLIDQWRRRIETLQQDRDERQSTVLKQQLLTTAAERRQLQMLGELQELERKLGSLTGKMSVGSMQTGTVDRERIQLEQRILGLRRQMKATADQQRADAGKYSIVPFDGKSGTTRRPILVECTSTGFRFVPEDVFISAADIEGFTERQNPLLAGAVALTQYWNQVNQEQGGTTPDTQPYVLLIVRPSGTLGYYVSVRLLNALKQQHGYELVADDVDLKWPAVDVGAQAACRAAVETMLAQRGAMTAQPGGPNIAGGMVGAGPGGERTGSGRSGMRPTGSGGSGPGGMTRGGGNGPGSSSAPGGRTGFQLSDLDTPGDEVGNRSWEDPSRFGGLEHRRDKTKTAGSTRAATGSSGVPSGTPNGSGSPGGPRGNNTLSNGAPSGPPSGNAPAKLATVEDPPSETAATSAVPSKSTADEKQNWTLRPISSSSSQTTAKNEDATSPTSDELPPTSSARHSSPLPPNGPRGEARPRNSGPPTNADQRMARGPKRGNGQDIPYEHLQRRRWGQFEDGANIGVEKPVTIRVDAEQMIVANQLIIPIRPGATRNEMFDQLLAAIDENAASWGPAAAGFFWVPSLRFVISPGGNQIYDRLTPLVTRSGLRADAEFTLERPDSSVQGGRP